MKQVEKLIENLEGKFKIKVESFLDLYERNASSELLQESLGITENTVRVITRTLNIRMPKKHRSNDLALLKSRFGDSAVSLDLQETKGDLEASYRDNLKLEKKLVEMRRELQKFKLVHKNPEIDFDEIRNAVLGAIRPVKPMEVKVLSKSSHFKNHTQLILLSDNHVEEVVSSKDVGLSNEYNWQIMEQRLAKVFAESINSYRGESKCIVASLGDQFSGIIYDTQEHTSKSIGEAISDYSHLLANHIRALSAIYDEVYIPVVFGNHGRLQQDKKSAGYGTDNFEYLMAQILKALLATEKNVTVDISTTGLLAFKVGNDYVGCHHGDYFFKSVGDVKYLRIKEHFKQTLGVEPNTILQGHTHVYNVEQMPRGGTYVTNGSLIGPNGYSVTNGMVGKDWGQVIMSFLPSGQVENIRLVGDE